MPRFASASLRALLGCLALAPCWLVSIAGAAGPDTPLAKKLAGVKFDHYAVGPGYSEGPTWRAGEVFFCSGGLLRVDAKKQVSKYLDISPAGTVLKADGHLLICDNKAKAIVDLSPEGKLGVVAERFETKTLRGMNDLTVDARGNVYWTDPTDSTLKNPVGNVFRVRPDGRVDLLTTGLAFPNGLEVDPASKYLYVIESQSKKILRYALPADDELLGKPETFYDLGGSGGDGCVFDAEGNLWVADFHRPETGHGRILVLSPKAEVLAMLDLPTKLVSNIAFGGPNHDEIFCTTGDAPGVFHAAVGVKGFAGHPGKAMPIIRLIDVVPLRVHADAETLKKVALTAADAKLVDGKFDSATRDELKLLAAAGLTDSQVRADLEQLMGPLETAAARYAQDKSLLAEVKRLKGTATLESSAPAWLRSIAGDEALPVFGRIVGLDLNERTDGHKAATPKALTERVHDAWLSQLAGQDKLRTLELSGTAVTSEGLVHLKDLKALEVLNICLTACSDAGFEHLAELTKMKRMVICASKITGSGFAHLQGMTQLESINLHSTPASDAGLEAIGKLPSLLRLEIVHTSVTDAGVGRLGGLAKLRQFHVASHDTTAAALVPVVGQLKELYELDVYEKAASNEAMKEIGTLPKLRMLRLFVGTFDDVGVAHLKGLTTLEELVLNSPNVTDAALDSLAGLTNLRKLRLDGTRTTPAGKTKLAAKLPNLVITP
ncbi:MAG: SMP-30/gluconolactonase/LRE family protein [Planctomycetia bacterium]|nr:SMP-30/gluconolactonase/LRE family protein [Planctomycetia bacterium]